MSKPQDGTKLKPRFKGIESLLKRIAFNLGNSPSQTEVKIISCIPIDVTDLQNKIIELERELDERATGPQDGAIVNTALGAPRLRVAVPPNPPPVAPDQSSSSTSQHTRRSQHLYRVSTPNVPADTTVQATDGPQKPNKEGKGLFQKVKKMSNKKFKDKTHLIYYAETTNDSPFRHKREPNTECKRGIVDDTMDREYLADVVRRQYRPEPLLGGTSCTSHFSSPVCRDDPGATPPLALDSDVCSCCHGRFHNLDTVRDTGFSCAAASPPPQPPVRRDNSMYYDSNLYDIVPVKERSTAFNETHDLYDIRESFIQRTDNFPEKFRTRPRCQPYIVNYTTIPSPVKQNHKIYYRKKIPRKPVHKREQVLKSMQKRKWDKTPNADSSRSCTIECGRVYIKATDKSKSLKMRTEIPQQQPPPPPPILPKPVLLKNAECLTMNVHDTQCQTATSRSVQLEPPPPEENKTEVTLNQIKNILHAVLTEVKTNSQIKNAVEDRVTKDAVVQKGPSQSNMATCSSFMNSYSYNPCNVNPFAPSCSTGSQMYPGISSQPPPPTGAASTFGPVKCMQNYPLFIHTTGRQCACCFRNMPLPPRASAPSAPVGTKPHPAKIRATAANTSTNTDSMREQRNKETEKLIKEIYKSLAVSTEYPAKDTSNSDYPELKSSGNTSQRIEFRYKPKSKVGKTSSAILTKSEAGRVSAAQNTESAKNAELKRNNDSGQNKVIVRNTEVRGTSPTPVFGSRAFRPVGTSNTASFRSELVSKTTTAVSARPSTTPSSAVQRRDLERLRALLTGKELASTGSEPDPPTPPPQLPMVPPGYVLVKEDQLPLHYSDEDTETPTTEEVESDETVVEKAEEKKEKKGIFRKMVNLFTSRSRQRRKKENRSSDREEEPASDSDEYETVYSQRSSRKPRRVSWREPARRGGHSKVSSRQFVQRRDRQRSRPRRSPYMEQEYRRQWNEKLMFHGGDTPRFSSDRPASRESRRRPPPPATYYRGYEARPVLMRRPSTPEQGAPMHTQTTQATPVEDKVMMPSAQKSKTKGLGWLKKHRLSIPCGCKDEWRRLILDG